MEHSIKAVMGESPHYMRHISHASSEVAVDLSKNQLAWCDLLKMTTSTVIHASCQLTDLQGLLGLA